MFISERRPIIVYFHNDEKDMVMFEEIIPMMKYFMNDKDDIKLVIVDVRKHEEAKLIRTVPHIFTVYGRTVVDEIVGLIDDFTFPLTLSLAKNIG